ncbi:hypothetical protein B879_04212 [Cecembia lonarensis LW9]|uniref:Uncharacterized protein n=1 Tax=Cecembia lonarensis (strain CCUG 58316 / KCTC 22772 / LW9) TaxID=1225176 RepID=K1LSW4_CECL9|nr:hypothetical protein B879_04212 [Cecembia lonarensis LW9]
MSIASQRQLDRNAIVKKFWTAPDPSPRFPEGLLTAAPPLISSLTAERTRLPLNYSIQTVPAGVVSFVSVIPIGWLIHASSSRTRLLGPVLVARRSACLGGGTASALERFWATPSAQTDTENDTIRHTLNPNHPKRLPSTQRPLCDDDPDTDAPSTKLSGDHAKNGRRGRESQPFG